MRHARFPRSVVLLAFTSLFADISTEMLYPVLPLFLTKELAAPVSVVGIVEGIADNLGAVARPLLAAGLLYLLHVDMRAVFFVAFPPGIVAFALVTTVRESQPAARTPEDRITLRELPGGYWRYLLAVGAFGIG